MTATPEPRAILHDYFRSSAAYRVRVALNLKRIVDRGVPVGLRVGEQVSAAHRAAQSAEVGAGA